MIQINSPLHRLQVVQEWTKTTTAFKYHGAKAPVVHSNSVGFILKQLRCLQRQIMIHLIDMSHYILFINLYAIKMLFSIDKLKASCAEAGRRLKDLKTLASRICGQTNDYLLAYQVLERADKRGTQTALVQVFSIAQVDDFVNQLKENKFI